MYAIDKRWIWAAAGAAGVLGLLLIRLRPESKGRRVWRRVKARREREQREQMEREMEREQEEEKK
jgi:heme exporter protein D